MQTNTSNETKTDSRASDPESRILQAMTALEAACRRAEAAEQRSLRSHRRAQLLGGAAVSMLVGMLALSNLKPVGAQGSNGPTLTSLQNQINALVSRMATVENKTRFMSAEATTQTTTFTGCNVQIVNGLGATNGEPGNPGDTTHPIVNSLGNLIIGYNDPVSDGINPIFPYNRTGSHNLILGDGQNYSSFGGLIAGVNNLSSGPYGSVNGGRYNNASGLAASIAGGYNNYVSGDYSWVGGGMGNSAQGQKSAVCGGAMNHAVGLFASVGGGLLNRANAMGSVVSGGNSNTAGGYASSISGGSGNNLTGQYASITGGYNNAATGDYSAILGGNSNTLSTDLGHIP